jgi:hypothetical protein
VFGADSLEKKVSMDAIMRRKPDDILNGWG